MFFHLLSCPQIQFGHIPIIIKMFFNLPIIIMKMLFKQIVLAKSSHRLLCWLDSDFLSKGMRTRSAAKYNWLGYKIEHIKVHILVSCSAGNHLKLTTTWLGITDWIIWWGHWRYAPEIVKIVNIVNMMEIVKNLPSEMEEAPPPSNSVIKLKMFSQKVSSKLLTWIHNVLTILRKQNLLCLDPKSFFGISVVKWES